MNAHALLTSQGWRGTGHSLHSSSDKIGLARPLLVSQKSNNLGVGKKQHKTSDMWWMDAFDKSLQGLDTSKQGQVVQTVTSGGLDMVAKGGGKWVGGGGGLYASFVRGEGLGGTLTPESREESGSGSTSGSEEPMNKKRKRNEGGKESKEDRKARKSTVRAARAEESAAQELPEVEEKTETREEKRARKAAKRALKGSAFEYQSRNEVFEIDVAMNLETKEERKERKRQKKLLKEAEEIAVEEASSEKAKKKKRRKG